MSMHGYDVFTFLHWLTWELRCVDATFEGFQRLFEEVMRRVDPEFIPIRAYGNLGDRKSDGLNERKKTIYQVYSPDELTQARVQAKIEEDLAGAVQHWKDWGLKKWIFVYNARRGLAPDIPKTLAAQRKRYPWLQIDHLSNDVLWEMVRALPLQVRSEILGAPSGFEDLFFTSRETAPNVVERLQRGRFVLIHDALSPIDRGAAAEALHPDIAFGAPISVRPKYYPEQWALAAAHQTELINELVERSSMLRPRFAVFSLSPIPLVVHLGFLLTDRIEVQAFQFDRDRRSWRWDDTTTHPDPAATISSVGVPDKPTDVAGDVILRVSLSGYIHPADTRVHVSEPLSEIEIAVPDPDPMWLRNPGQLTELAREFRRVLTLIGRRLPGVERIHLFVYAPTPACLVLGQAINPRKMPPVYLYEFDRHRKPRYKHVLTLTTAGAHAP